MVYLLGMKLKRCKASCSDTRTALVCVVVFGSFQLPSSHQKGVVGGGVFAAPVWAIQQEEGIIILDVELRREALGAISGAA